MITEPRVSIHLICRKLVVNYNSLTNVRRRTVIVHIFDVEYSPVLTFSQSKKAGGVTVVRVSAV